MSISKVLLPLLVVLVVHGDDDPINLTDKGSKENSKEEGTDDSCGSGETPDNWEPKGNTDEDDMDWLHDWWKLLDEDGKYDCKWDAEACKKEFISEAKEKEICKKCKEASDDVKEQVICIGKEIKKLFEGDKKKKCWGHADALREVLEHCGIKGVDFQSAWDKDRKVGHSWVEVTVKKDDGSSCTLLADCYNDIYVEITTPAPSGGVRRAATLARRRASPLKTKCRVKYLDRACHTPCSYLPAGLHVREINGIGMRMPLFPGGGGFGMGMLGGLPSFLSSATQYGLPFLPVGHSLEFQCCKRCNKGCVVYLAVYRCGICSDPVDGDLALKPNGLLATGWDAGPCGPSFHCGSDYSQKTTIYRYFLSPGQILSTAVADENMHYLGVWGETCVRPGWCQKTPSGPFKPYAPCREHCCPDGGR